MSVVRPRPAPAWAPAKPLDAPGLPSLSEGALEAAGLSLATLFGPGTRAWRRVESVGARGLEVEGSTGTAWLPRRLAPRAVAGQWLRFDRAALGRVRVEVDLPVTLKAEARLVDLFQQLTSPPG